MKPVYTHFSHWLPRFINQGAITLGHHIYFFSAKRDVSRSLLKHEMIHVAQIEKVGLIRFYIRYLKEYVLERAMGENHKTAYRSISFEVEAYKRQHEPITQGEHVALTEGGYRV